MRGPKSDQLNERPRESLQIQPLKGIRLGTNHPEAKRHRPNAGNNQVYVTVLQFVYLAHLLKPFTRTVTVSRREKKKLNTNGADISSTIVLLDISARNHKSHKISE